ncbi:MAG: efflux RND transporter periplasmic adaptor subunit [Phycisphaerae bacterium]|nr:efflux RND transporter periplasmic adaptor subunit [Phycisphaerae bacterium]
MKKGWLIVALVVIVIAILAAWEMTKPDAVAEVIQPRVAAIRAYVEELAVTELPQDYLVAMPIDGRLEPITLREGDAVKQGDVIARLDTADLADQVEQARQRIAVLETKLESTSDDRLEEHALTESRATVKAINETVAAAEKKRDAYVAVHDFAVTEYERIKGVYAQQAAAQREISAAEMEMRKAEAELQSEVFNLAALKTIAAVAPIGPQFIADYIDRKKFELREYERQLAEAKAALNISERNLARAEITSPIDGVVLERHQTRRQVLPAGTPLLTVGSLDGLEVVAEVLTERATRFEPGDLVEVYGEAIPDGPIRGTVSRVYPAGFKKISSLGVEQQRVKVAIKLEQRPERLGVAYRVQVRIIYDEAVDALTLPRTALFRASNGQWQVMLVDAGRTRLQAVSVGLMNDDQAQVLDGLTAESQVVARPSREVEAGMSVRTTDGR